MYRNVPDGEDDFLFQYSITTINSDATTAVITFEQRCITEDADDFQDYPNTTDEETIDNYQLVGLDDDHELYSTQLGRVNKIINDREAAEKAAIVVKVEARPKMSVIFRSSLMQKCPRSLNLRLMEH